MWLFLWMAYSFCDAHVKSVLPAPSLIGTYTYSLVLEGYASPCWRITDTRTLTLTADSTYLIRYNQGGSFGKLPEMGRWYVSANDLVLQPLYFSFLSEWQMEPTKRMHYRLSPAGVLLARTTCRDQHVPHWVKQQLAVD